jgi:hypothetical protein
MRNQLLFELSVVCLFLDVLFISQFSVLRVSYMCILFDFDSYFLRFLKGLLLEILARFTLLLILIHAVVHAVFYSFRSKTQYCFAFL